jgi:fumarate hydratase class I
VATRLKLSGKIIVGRDIAHAKLKERLDSGQGLPDYLKDHIIYYAGPAKTPDGYASGSFGPPRPAAWIPTCPSFRPRGIHGDAGQGQPLQGR